MTSELALRLVAKLPPRYQNTAKQFIKFGVTGTIGAVVDFSTYAILTRGVGWVTLYSVAGYEISAANNVSVFLAIASNFIINKYWTFNSAGGNVAAQGIGYLILNIITWVLNQILMSFFAFQVPFFEAAFGDQKDFAAKVAAIGIILFVNFFGSKFIVFRKKPAPTPYGQIPR